MFRAIRNRIQRSLHHTRTRLVNPDAAEQTVQQLEEDGVLSPEQAAMLRDVLPRQIAESHYVLGHFGAHVGIGVGLSWVMIPLPIGTASRVIWVLGNRLVETLRRRPEHARVHSRRVLLMAMVPWLGYSAYLIPLRRQYG